VKYRALVIGAGRIGAGYGGWADDAYTHAGAYRALSSRCELVGFVEPDLERRVKANLKWKVPTYENLPVGLAALKPDIVSVCVQPNEQAYVYKLLSGIKGIWQEKPFIIKAEGSTPIQVNYMRRGDEYHREIYSREIYDSHSAWRLVVYGKDDIHTRCHFEDLSKWWSWGIHPMPLDYRPFNGPCAYILENQASGKTWFFDNGGVDGGECFKAMLGNLLDHIEGKADLWSPPY
jgi:hypothetical protein